MSLINYTYLKPNLSGFYVGKVVDNFDPENMGRVKCSIPGILDIDKIVNPDAEEGSGIPRTRAEAIEGLPWVYQISQSFNAAGMSGGIVSIPALGSSVIIQFPNQDIYFPVYFGVLQGKMDYSKQYNEKLSQDAETADRAPAPPNLTGAGNTAQGIVTSSGTQISIDDVTGRICIWHHSSSKDCPTEIKISPNGEVFISSAKEVTINSGRDLNLSAFHDINLNANNVNISASAKVRFDSPNVSSRGMVLSDYGVGGAIVGVNGVVATFNKGALVGLR